MKSSMAMAKRSSKLSRVQVGFVPLLAATNVPAIWSVKSQENLHSLCARFTLNVGSPPRHQREIAGKWPLTLTIPLLEQNLFASVREELPPLPKSSHPVLWDKVS